MDAMKIIETVYDAGATTKKVMLETLEDGEAMLSLGITDADQDDVEQAYQMLGDSDIDKHLAAGGMLGNYQW